MILAARCKQPLLALENHGEIGGQVAASAPLLYRVDTEHHPQAPPIGVLRSGEAHAQAAAVRTQAALAFDLGVVPVNVQVQGSADAGAQVAVAGRQTAAGRAFCSRRRRERGRRGSSCRVREGHTGRRETQGAQREGRDSQHAGQCTAPPRSGSRPQAPGSTSNAFAMRACPRAIQRAACISNARTTTPAAMANRDPSRVWGEAYPCPLIWIMSRTTPGANQPTSRPITIRGASVQRNPIVSPVTATVK